MSIYSFKDSVYICAYEVKRKSKLHLLCVVCAIERAHWEAQLKKKSLEGMGRTQLLKVERQNLDVKISKENMYFSMWNE